MIAETLSRNMTRNVGYSDSELKKHLFASRASVKSICNKFYIIVNEYLIMTWWHMDLWVNTVGHPV